VETAHIRAKSRHVAYSFKSDFFPAKRHIAVFAEIGLDARRRISFMDVPQEKMGFKR
jgi:hypothetical protein